MRPGPDSRYTVSPAVGEYALTEVIPALERRVQALTADKAELLARVAGLEARCAELRGRIALLSMPNGGPDW